VELSKRTIPSLVEFAAGVYGDTAAIEDGDTRLSFKELAAASSEAARAFMAAGVEHGDRVAIWSPNRYEWIVAALGAQSAGAVLVPLNTRFKGAEAGYILEKSGAKILVTVGEFLGTRYFDLLRDAMGSSEDDRPVAGLPDLKTVVLLDGEGEGGVSWRQLLSRAGEVTEEAARERAGTVAESHLSDIMFTSGTTGVGCLVSFAARPCCRTPFSTSVRSSIVSAKNASACCRARPPSTKAFSRRRNSASTTSRVCAWR
jgi:acyl-coenzyme A synthetase/AMP-(fatty) acid ligase